MALEQVLFVHRELDVFRIPPRTGAGGWRSGDWRIADKIFTGRVRVVAVGDKLEIRLEDAQTGELFGVAPIPPGQAHIVVEQASDSSRNFVLRLEDAESRRHAFVGASFGERSAAFDFNVAIGDHERQQRRASEIASIQGAADPAAAAADLLPEAAALYRPVADLSLKEGETIKITVKKKEQHGAGEGDSFLARLGHTPAAVGTSGTTNSGLVALAPPPGPLPSAAPAAAAQHQAAAAPVGDLLGWAAPTPGSSSMAPPSAAGAEGAPPADAGWATFD